MRFSERKGYKTVSKIIQFDGINDDLRIALWNILYTNARAYFSHVRDFKKIYWSIYEKKTLDSLPGDLTDHIKEVILSGTWYEVYDFLEFLLNYHEMDPLAPMVNETLEKELAAYRFINGTLCQYLRQKDI